MFWSAGAPLVGKPELDKKVELRMSRQRVLTRTNLEPVRLDAVLHEATLHRVIGSDDTMVGQLNHLLEVTQLPNVEVRILPFRPARTPNHAYPEDITVIQKYAAAYQRLRMVAEEPAPSRDLIARIATQYK